MAATKKGRKGGKKKGRKGGHKKSAARRGAAKRLTLKVGHIVVKKPSKATLKKHHLHVKKVGTYNGKTAWKIERNKKRNAPARGFGPVANPATYGKNLEKQHKAREAELTKKWKAVIRLRKRAEELGVAEDVSAARRQEAALKTEIAQEKAAAAAAKAQYASPPRSGASPFAAVGSGYSVGSILGGDED